MTATEGRRRMAAGMRQAEDHADPRVVLAIDAAIERAIASGEPFSANDIRDEFPNAQSKGLVGGRFRSYAARRKPRLMVHTGRYEKSNLPDTHCAEIKVWVGAAASCEEAAS